MDTNIALSVVAGVGSIAYVCYLARKAVKDTQAHEQAVGQRYIPLLLPEQADSAHQPKPSIAVRFAEAWKEVKEEKKIKELPPLEKVHYTALEEEEEEPEEEETSEVPPLVPTQSIASNVPIDQLEAHSKKLYYSAICDIADKVVLHYEKHSKITRDGMVPSSISRKDWDYTMSQPNGIFWRAHMLENQNGATVILPDCDSCLHLFLRERGYVFIDGMYSEEE